MTPSLSNSFLTCKYKFLEASDKPYIQMFNFQTTSFSSNSGGGIKYTTLPISFPCKKGWFCINGVACLSVGCHDQKNKSKTLFSAGRWDFISEKPSSKPQATNLALIFFFSLTIFSFITQLVVF